MGSARGRTPGGTPRLRRSAPMASDQPSVSASGRTDNEGANLMAEWKTAFMIGGLYMAALAAIAGPAAAEGGEATPGAAAARHFRMGFTPFPYDISLQALADTRSMLRENGDLVAAHFEGVPWVEALSGAPFHPNLLSEWQRCRDALGPNSVLYLALSPLDMSRARMAPSRAEREGMPIPEAIAGKPFDDPQVMEAYTSYCLRAAKALEPRYLAIGIEANELYHNDRSKWDEYVRLHRHVYEAIKRARPNLPVFATFTLHNMANPGWTDRTEAVAAWHRLMKWNDAVAVSYYPFMSPGSGGVARTLEWLDKDFGREGKPFAVAETGDLAEPLVLTQPAITLPGSPEQQAAHLRQLLAFARGHDTLFVNWFVSRDYDAMWEKIKATSPEFFKVWKNCGLLDGQGQARPALKVWRECYDRPLGTPPKATD